MAQRKVPFRKKFRKRYDVTLSRGTVSRLLLLLCLLPLSLVACGKTKQALESESSPCRVNSGGDLASLAQFDPANPAAPSKTIALPLNFGRHTGDLKEMIERRNIRALVMMNPIGFFYVQGHPKGAIYETMEDFQRYVNKKLKTGSLKVRITFLPVTPKQAEAALTEGLGDFIANPVVITPEREKRVLFTSPVVRNVTQIIVSGSDFGPVSTVEDLSGKQIDVNPVATYCDNLEKLNTLLKKNGKKPIQIKAVDANLNDDDLIEMVHAGLLPATVTITPRAELWSKVFDDLRLHAEIPVANNASMAMVVRKGNPRLKELLDGYISTHAVGTKFGNIMLRRYLQDTKWVKNSTSPTQMEKFQTLVGLFRKYGGEYHFDYLMLAAQGYQESMLNPNLRSRRGAVGIMQVLPRYAAKPPISIRNVIPSDANVHAGAKILRNIADTYFKDPQLDPMNRALFALASYNAGPNRITRARQRASRAGLNPNLWFGNVELEVAKDVGQETVTYVDNVYKYYVAYKLALETTGIQKKREIAAMN
jgi:membrane-bound lytic murein transglycosylase MltF